MRKRMLGVLATAAAFAGVVGAAATPAAAADDWIDTTQVLSITDPKTALSKDTWAGTVQVRHGTYGGTQYGWGRVLNPAAGYNLIFEVDTDGDHYANMRWIEPDLSGGGTTWTGGYRTSSSSTRAFRACITTYLWCHYTDNRTDWW